MSTTRTQRPSADTTRADIMDAALDLFSELSFEGASTRRIAQRAGAAVGHEGKAAGAVFHAFGLQLLLGLADPGDFR